jgi:hypothetical protein
MRPFRLISAAFLAAIGVWFATAAGAADDPFHNYLYNTCLETESYWIGKDAKSVEANCACKAKTEEKLASPGFKEAVMKQQPYDQFPFGDPATYQQQLLTACPKLRPLAIETVCKDPATPKGACDDFKKMVDGLK